MSIYPRRKPLMKGDTCGRCNGSGLTAIDFVEQDCPDCRGTGLINSPNACTVCKGSGTVISEELGTELDCDHCNASASS